MGQLIAFCGALRMDAWKMNSNVGFWFKTVECYHYIVGKLFVFWFANIFNKTEKIGNFIHMNFRVEFKCRKDSFQYLYSLFYHSINFYSELNDIHMFLLLFDLFFFSLLVEKK